MSMKLQGSCHCGNIRVVFEPALGIEALSVRACRCSFCRRHGARTVTDPEGTVEIHVRDTAAVTHYRFDQKTADYMLCAHCGVYVVAVLVEPAGAWATVNCNVLEGVPSLTETAVPVDYSGEEADARRDRRRKRWTPVTRLP